MYFVPVEISRSFSNPERFVVRCVMFEFMFSLCNFTRELPYDILLWNIEVKKVSGTTGIAKECSR